jgi:hypothetical protein
LHGSFANYRLSLTEEKFSFTRIDLAEGEAVEFAVMYELDAVATVALLK